MARALDVLATALLAMALGWILLVGALAWLLRDGLGADAVPSGGLDALARWTTTFGYGPVALALGVVALLADLAARSAARRARLPAT